MTAARMIGTAERFLTGGDIVAPTGIGIGAGIGAGIGRGGALKVGGRGPPITGETGATGIAEMGMLELVTGANPPETGARLPETGAAGPAPPDTGAAVSAVASGTV